MHDYQHPPEWPSMSDQERADWYTRERARRQAMRQRGTGDRLARAQERFDRRQAGRTVVQSADAVSTLRDRVSVTRFGMSHDATAQRSPARGAVPREIHHA